MEGLENCFNCGSTAERFEPQGGGSGVRCTGCGNALWHTTLDEEEMARVWNWRQTTKEAAE